MKLYVKLIKLKVVQCRLVTVSVYQFKIPRFCDKGISNWIYSRVGIHVLAYFQLVYEHGLRALWRPLSIVRSNSVFTIFTARRYAYAVVKVRGWGLGGGAQPPAPI